MSKIIVFGGLLGLIGGGAMLVQLLTSIHPGELGWNVNLVIITIVLVGGFLGIVRKKFAGGILLVMGILLIILGAVSYLTPMIDLLPYSGFTELGIGRPLSNLVAGIPVEAFLIVIGGILVLASPQD